MQNKLGIIIGTDVKNNGVTFFFLKIAKYDILFNFIKAKQCIFRSLANLFIGNHYNLLIVTCMTGEFDKEIKCFEYQASKKHLKLYYAKNCYHFAKTTMKQNKPP